MTDTQFNHSLSQLVESIREPGKAALICYFDQKRYPTMHQLGMEQAVFCQAMKEYSHPSIIKKEVTAYGCALVIKTLDDLVPIKEEISKGYKGLVCEWLAL